MSGRNHSQALLRLTVFTVGVACLLMSPACKTKQTVTTRSSRYAIDQGAWEKSGDGDDTEELRAKFGTSYSDAYGEDEYGGDARRSPLEGQMFDSHSGGGDFTEQEFRGAREFGESTEFRTPEYLRRQEIRAEDAREAGRLSRAGQVAYRDGERNFRGGDEELSFWQRLNPFRRRSTPAREADRTFIAEDYRPGNRATESARVPEPMGSFGEGPGDYRENTMSMDDVKKLLNPAAFD